MFRKEKNFVVRQIEVKIDKVSKLKNKKKVNYWKAQNNISTIFKLKTILYSFKKI